MAAKIYTDKDADLSSLQGKKLAVIGFGSQGHAHALNLKDSGCEVIIGLYPQSKSREVAEKLGFQVMDTGEAIAAADVIFVAVPDTVIPSVYESDIAPNLTEGKCLLFSHGFAIHFETITVPDNIDVIMVAPKGPGHTVRSQFVEKKGVPTLIAIHQDATGQAHDIALGWAKGIGGTRAGVFETNFREETVTDLFGEQCVLCGGASALVKAGFETLVEAGYQPEMAYFECLHELKLIVDLMVESGIAGMRFSISETAEYGDVTVGPKIIDSSVKERMAQQLKAIENGEFAKEWTDEYNAGGKNFDAIREKEAQHPIEDVGGKLRSMMSWLGDKKVGKGQSQASYVSGSN
ncbi:ketol-acid reductoisomerase [Roseibacillus ishigakijimensis]|uniref:Ketol-acid reductoisomerase (NADP(+)) n=1 Tax=Roseibacillus ishigakijimensis TaxID=454146 RepID=A0A934RP68_9BACT|nr:ketol-acid reductoisomerase [Roseibacillus ishigakijimensis]MBK1832933.1 ketol-acid reductoisomerase [Roseibacillus ishigakijimensis]